MDEGSLMLLLAQGLSVEKIAKRFGKNPSTVAYWMRKHGLRAPEAEKHAPKGGLERERLAELVADGLTIAEIADAVGLSKGAVRHWLKRYGLRTAIASGRRSSAEVRAAREAGRHTVVMSCPAHGSAEFVIEGRGYYRCKRCRSEAVTNRRRRVKTILVAEAGGCCLLCGYDRCHAALAFHHLDPSQKRLVVSANGNGLALNALRAEEARCVLLCANCHAEVESGVVSLSIK